MMLSSQAAVLNAAALRYVQANDLEQCDQILKLMAEKEPENEPRVILFLQGSNQT